MAVEAELTDREARIGARRVLGGYDARLERDAMHYTGENEVAHAEGRGESGVENLNWR